jgi:predicted nucleic acid-binding protein
MTDKPFADTNIFLYAKFNDGTLKHKIAFDLLEKEILKQEPCISTQVAGEFYVNALRKGLGIQDAQETVEQFNKKFNVIDISMQTVFEAFRILNRYQLSYWDSLIIAAALEADCTVLYTEDLQDGMIIDNTLKIINPFSPRKPS